MKWLGYNKKGETKMKRLLSVRGLGYLLAIASLGLLLGASWKWHPF